MSSDDWTAEVLKQLKIRDGFEKRDDDVFTAFQDLIAKFKRNLDVNQEVGEDVKEDKKKLIESLNCSAIELDKLKVTQRKNESTIESLSKTVKKLNTKVENLTMELKEKDKTIEIVNDELLLLTMQNNVLTQKVEELSGENESLIQRWMNKASQDADKLNDANQFLESVKGRV